MKKFIGYTISALIALSAVSCFGDKHNFDVDETAPGKVIYAQASDVNMFSLDPFNMAFRFNILLSEASVAEEAGGSRPEFDDIKVDIEGESVSLTSILYEDSQIEDMGDGTYRITFSGDSFNGHMRNGILEVNTGGKLLSELETGDAWTISLLPKSHSGFQYSYYGSDYTFISGSFAIFRGDEAACWDIKVSDYKISGSNWNGEYTLKQTAGKEMLTFSNSRASTFEMTGEGSGNSFPGASMKYLISESKPLTYVPGCAKSYSDIYLQEGEVTASFLSLGETENIIFPSPFVKIEWVKGTQNCSCQVYITYNGTRKKYTV